MRDIKHVIGRFFDLLTSPFRYRHDKSPAGLHFLDVTDGLGKEIGLCRHCHHQCSLFDQ